MQLAPTVSAVLPQGVAGFARVNLTTVSTYGAALTSLVPGQLVVDGRSPGAGATVTPRIDVIDGAFEHAVRAARALSASAPLGSGAVRGYQPVAILQAADGTRAITPLLTREGSWMLMASDFDTLPYRYSRNVDGLVAIVSAERTLDMRTIPVGGSL